MYCDNRVLDCAGVAVLFLTSPHNMHADHRACGIAAPQRNNMLKAWLDRETPIILVFAIAVIVEGYSIYAFA